jgi:hypothetical protein
MFRYCCKGKITNPYSGNISILEKTTSNKDISGKEIGFKQGVNNDICICCECAQTLKPVLTWTTPIESKRFDLTCGQTYTDRLECFQPYTISVNNPCGANCQPDEVITTITYPGGATTTSTSLAGATLIANAVGTYTVSIRVKCNGKWCSECKITFKQTKKCEPPCDNCKDKVHATFNSSASTAVLGTHPAATTINASFLLDGGSDTYTQVRASIVDFNLRSDNPSCLQSYTTPNNWGSITAGSLGGFSSAITTYPGVGISAAVNNPREITFSTTTPVNISSATALNLTLKIPGVNPLSCCCLKIVLFVKITYRNNKCEECTKIVPISITECPKSETSAGGVTFDKLSNNSPQYILHSPSNDDIQILNQPLKNN